jgi:hypothetical protein
MGRNALLAVLFALLAGCGEPSPGAAASAPRPTTAPATPRLLVVGWDGASFRAIDPLLAEGKLPHLSGLIARGTRGVIESTIIPISSAAWTTATTGMGPGVHGVFAFHEPVQGSYDLALVSSRSNRSAPLWRLLTGRGIPSLVFGVPLTYPPEPILGTMVCGMLAPRTAVYTWPAALTESLRARGFQPDLDPWLEEREPTLDEAREQLDVREQILGELLARDDWRLAWIVFKELDVLSHYSYGVDFDAHVGPPQLHPRVQPARLAHGRGLRRPARRRHARGRARAPAGGPLRAPLRGRVQAAPGRARPGADLGLLLGLRGQLRQRAPEPARARAAGQRGSGERR